jgi:LPXTG-motif cell wall-anchored protein
MHKRIFTISLALAFFAVAGAGLAQNADRNTAAPTKNDLRLRLTEPAEGTTITGSSVRVAVEYNRTIFGAGQGTKFGEATFPPAKFAVFLDNKLQQTLTAGESNVATIDNVPAGSHKVVVVAKNISGEVIDRKEVNFQNVSAVAASTAPAPASAPEAPPAPAPSSSYTVPPPSAPSAPETPSTLPKTASSAPSLAVAGLALALSGLLTRRRGR